MEDFPPMETEGEPINLRNEVHVAMAGKSGAGKSTLISTVFGGEMSLELSPVAENNTQVLEKDGIRIYINEELRELAQHSIEQPKVDLLIYCLSIAPSSKFADSNPAIMENLHCAFGPKIWENCILALTFSNDAWKRCGKISRQPRRLTQVEEYEKYINEYINLFKEELKKLEADVDVQLVFDFPLTPTQLDPRTILAIPAGEELEDEVLPGFNSISINITAHAEAEEITLNSWRDIFFYTAVLKCRSSTQESFQKYKLGTILGKLAAGFEALGGGVGVAAAGVAAAAVIGSFVVGPVGVGVTILGGTAVAVVGTIISAKK